MNLHEYQAKQLFAEYGLPVSKGIAVDTADAAVAATAELGGDRWVFKVQVHAGGRGKAGGVELVDDPEAARAFAAKWLRKNLVTIQTDAKGQPVSKIYVESCADIDRELYLGALLPAYGLCARRALGQSRCCHLARLASSVAARSHGNVAPPW